MSAETTIESSGTHPCSQTPIRPARLCRLATHSLLLLFVAFCFVPPVQGDSAPVIRYVGIRGARAYISINHRTYLLEVGEEGKSGVKLLSVSKKAAVLRYHGTNYLYDKGAVKGKVLPREVTIVRGPNNMFLTPGTIDGAPVEFIVDTGASHVVLSADRARKLRLRYSRQQPVRVTTASRTETAYAVKLRSVSVGGIFRNQVDALVTRGNFPETVLLGMSFLGQLQIRQEADRLVITE